MAANGNRRICMFAYNTPCRAGASIITGIEPDVEKGLRSDPSAVICKCVLGWLGQVLVVALHLAMPRVDQHAGWALGSLARGLNRLPASRNSHAFSVSNCPTCRQLGIRLHELGERLPLLDTATGQAVPAQLDAEVEK